MKLFEATKSSFKLLSNDFQTTLKLTGQPAHAVGLVFDFVATWIKKLFCEIVNDPCWFLNEFW